MTVMTASNCVRNSAVLIDSLSSENWTITATWPGTTSAPVYRDIGGSTMVLVGAPSTPHVTEFGKDEKLAFLVAWVSTAGVSSTGAHQLQVTQGTVGKGAWQRALGSYNLTLHTASSAGFINKWIVGPFESARFAHSAETTALGQEIGKNYVSIRFASTDGFTTSQAAHVQIKPFRLPDVSYDT